MTISYGTDEYVKNRLYRWPYDRFPWSQTAAQLADYKAKNPRLNILELEELDRRNPDLTGFTPEQIKQHEASFKEEHDRAKLAAVNPPRAFANQPAFKVSPQPDPAQPVSPQPTRVEMANRNQPVHLNQAQADIDMAKAKAERDPNVKKPAPTQAEIDAAAAKVRADADKAKPFRV